MALEKTVWLVRWELLFKTLFNWGSDVSVKFFLTSPETLEGREGWLLVSYFGCLALVSVVADVSCHSMLDYVRTIRSSTRHISIWSSTFILASLKRTVGEIEESCRWRNPGCMVFRTFILPYVAVMDGNTKNSCFRMCTKWFLFKRWRFLLRFTL